MYVAINGRKLGGGGGGGYFSIGQGLAANMYLKLYLTNYLSEWTSEAILKFHM